MPIKAVLPKADLIVPENLTFGMCAIEDTCELSFKLSNPRLVYVDRNSITITDIAYIASFQLIAKAISQRVLSNIVIG